MIGVSEPIQNTTTLKLKTDYDIEKVMIEFLKDSGVNDYKKYIIMFNEHPYIFTDNDDYDYDDNYKKLRNLSINNNDNPINILILHPSS